MILGLRLDRRLVASVALEDEEFVFSDSRFVPSRLILATALGRYFKTILEQLKPVAIYYYVPDGPGAVTALVLKTLDLEAGHAGVPLKPVSRMDLFGSFGVLPLRTRRELRAVLEELWPGLSQGMPHRQLALAEAAATALVGDMWQVWPPL
jgi:hypothetical protein